jgi:hypothetical protein
VAYNVTNSGSKSIPVPYYASTNCLIRIQSTNGTPADWSDAPFTIQVTNANTNIGLQSLWNLAPGSRSYLPAGGNNSERGLAYDANRDEVYVVYASSPSSANVLDGTTGSNKWSLNLSGVSGGGFALDKAGVTLDGVIYIGNVATPGAGSAPVFKLYRWADSNPGTVPAVAYSGSAGFPNGTRVGDLMALRGCGTNTQILVGGRSNNAVCLLTTGNGTNLIAQTITTDTSANQIGGALAFGSGYSFWGSTNGLPPLKLNFDLVSLAATGAQVFPANTFPSACGAMNVDAANSLLAAVNLADGSDQLNLYDLAPTNAPVLLASWTFPGTWDNTFGLGGIAFGGNRLYALDSNNGLLAFKMGFPGPATTLSVTRTGTNVGLAWFATARGFVLQQRTNLLAGSSWQCACEPVWVTTNSISATQAVNGAAVFYRLNKP